MTTEPDSNRWLVFLSQGPETWLGNYSAVLSASQAISEAWLKHRSAQVQSNLDAWGKLAGCKEVAEMTAIQQGWYQDATKRLSAEIAGYQTQVADLVKHVSAVAEPPPAQRRTPAKVA
ncbi:MAG: phasin family protein [Proteobacteria bacterium]|nr:phasin family protein [Pseudomonadota bacterium]